jgi:hypothetical protein
MDYSGVAEVPVKHTLVNRTFSVPTGHKPVMGVIEKQTVRDLEETGSAIDAVRKLRVRTTVFNHTAVHCQ